MLLNVVYLALICKLMSIKRYDTHYVEVDALSSSSYRWILSSSILKEQSQVIEIKQTNNQTTMRYWKNKEFMRKAPYR